MGAGTCRRGETDYEREIQKDPSMNRIPDRMGISTSIHKKNIMLRTVKEDGMERKYTKADVDKEGDHGNPTTSLVIRECRLRNARERGWLTN